MSTPDRSPEGWHVRSRPAFIAGIAIPVGLLVVFLVAGYFYMETLQPRMRVQIASFPAPRLETAKVIQPPTNALPGMPPPASVARAMAEIAAQGDQSWEETAK